MSRAFTHWATSADLVGLRAPVHDAGTGLAGRPLGRAARGGAFVLDPFDAYAAGLITNPNVVVAGSIGAGKSTVVKMVLDRALERGRRAVVVDPKGEYADLARAYGATPVALGRDGWCDPLGVDDDSLVLLRSVLATARGAPLDAEEHYELERAWAGVRGRPTRVLAALAERLAPALDGPSGAARSVALALRRLTDGDLARLFDGPGDALDLAGELVVIDLSAQWSSHRLPLAALSAVAAAQRVASQGSLGYLVLDESWVLLQDATAMAWLQGSWKLARARGLCHVLVLHRFSDALTAGERDSAQRERARGLLRECETALLFRQPPPEAAEIAAALGLAAVEERALSALARGTALVRYGPHRSVVRVEPDARDAGFIDTDGAMRGE